jgi:DNA mismatch repair protein MutL
LRDSYIVVQGDDGLYYIDQHALAERISFERMKKEITVESNLKSDTLLQPLLLEMPVRPDIENKIAEINAL